PGVALADDLARHAVEAQDELADGGGGGGGEAELHRGVRPDLVADGRAAVEVEVAHEGAGGLDAALRGDPHRAGGGQHGGAVAAGLAAGGPDPHVDGHGGALDGGDEVVEAVVGDDGPAAVHLEHQR